jgi:thiol-disulfide isomerase/thioredoxin
MDFLLRLLVIPSASAVLAWCLMRPVVMWSYAGGPSAEQESHPRPTLAIGTFPVLEHVSAPISLLHELVDSSDPFANVAPDYLSRYLADAGRPRVLLILGDAAEIDFHFVRICSTLPVDCLAVVFSGAARSTSSLPLAQIIPQIALPATKAATLLKEHPVGAYVFDVDGELIWFGSFTHIGGTPEAVLRAILSVRRPPVRLETDAAIHPGDAGTGGTPPPDKGKSPGHPSTPSIGLHALAAEVFPLDHSQEPVRFNQSWAVKEATRGGRPALLIFWATWCLPCVAEAPDIGELARRYEGIMFIGLADDVNNGETRSRISALAAANGLHLQYLLKNHAILRRIFNEQDTALPAFALFEGGKATFTMTGSIRLKPNRALLENALRAAAARGARPAPGR